MKVKLLAAALASTLILAGCNESKEQAVEQAPAEKAPVELSTEKQKLSYIFGQNIGSQFKGDGVDIDLDIFSEAISDALAGKEPRMSEEEIKATLMAYRDKKIAEQQQEMESLAAANRAEGENYMTENGQKEGVVSLDSGLQYKVLTAGEGPVPTEESKVEVHYKGTLIDGTEFDSSFKRGVPATFGVTQVIPGWTEALMLMPEGSKWELVIPPSLAYGPGGAGGMIGPEQTLIFEVELLKANADEEEESSED